ncbi:uncharacterized protein LY89DRAFT_779820 [Mollisia scopiformis]|uniref:Pentatricopeptide repeat-containing protein n=1 Tax=Mollisia scopiformis TaxID=149040 RepID=A0A194XIJ7_MOLSC|nr:uncharacterized protein LY89DRAFT_779820 [Mollisia scopiformis]KUJ19944.1 hypothetical protein LY89DRAFT_779820 [Mollisia scopiformis]
MLTCYGCMRHCLQAIIGNAAVISNSSNRRLAAGSGIYGPFVQSFTTVTAGSRRPKSSSNDDFQPPQIKTAQKSKPEPRIKPELLPWQIKAQKRGNKGKRQSERLLRKESPGRDITDREMSLHLKYLRDPIKLAEFVRDTLRHDNYDLAQKVVNEASSRTSCTVSWNHIIEWQLSRGRMNAAIKCYNEMKKRAQVPDAQTYTIIFNGCSQHKDSDNALAKVLTMYHSMLTEKAPIRPNTIHLNAVLKMCARARNMGAMFSIMDQMPKKGLSSPNNLTYTTVFNALRMYIVAGPRDKMTPMQRRQFQQENILHARYLWADVVKAWRQGDIWIDEELVCAMGRILLSGNEQDNDDVLSLVEQTMNIPRQVPRKGTIERYRHDPATQGQQPTEIVALRLKDPSNPDVEPAQKLTLESKDTSTLDVKPAEDFPPEPISPVVFSNGVSDVYAAPRQNTLSLVIQSLTELHLKDVAAKYWELFSNDYNVAPDAENYHSYLRILRLSRSSTEVVNLMMKMPRQYMQAKTFLIAMSTCSRDKNNRHAFANAGKILDLMQTTLQEPEILALQHYLEVAMTSPPHTGKQSSSNNNEPSKYEQGRQIGRALQRLEPSILTLRSSLAFRDPSLPDLDQTARKTFVDNIIVIMRRMIAAYDILINNAMVPMKDHRHLKDRRGILAAFVTRHKAGPRNGARVGGKPMDATSTVNPEGLAPELHR